MYCGENSVSMYTVSLSRLSNKRSPTIELNRSISEKRYGMLKKLRSI